ncbi:MAG: MBL fold metallo-hydrolase [Parachlamydiales bacterium]|jgi:glyoxylase-like metal-dependent hydrolase (beta-lactamase superfamily II)
MKLSIVESNSLRLDGGAMFGHVPKTVWEKWEAPDSFNRIHLTTRCLLVQTSEGRNILFEAGIGNFFEPKLMERYGVEPQENKLLSSLAKIGLSENDIDSVVLSHLHFDHAGGILSAFGEDVPKLFFPKAQFFVGAKQWENALSPHPREKASFIPHLQGLLKESGRLKLIEKDSHLDLGKDIHFEFSDGHTLGLMLSWIETAEGPVIFVSDLIPGRHWIHIPVVMGYDRFGELKVDEKRSFLERLIQRKNARLFFTHDLDVPYVSVAKDDKGNFIWRES